MVENLLRRRPVYSRDRAAARAPEERERREQARRAAEALFAPKPPASEPPADPLVRPARVLPAAQATEQPGTITPETAKPGAIPADTLKRIRAWKRYGMTVPQIAEVCGVDIAEIERLLSQA